MMKNFPSNPTTGQTVTFGDVEYTFNGTSWKSIAQPIEGVDGLPGKSAYEIAVNEGFFTGTVEEYIEWLKGPAGQGIPAGGTTGQLLSKVSNTDYDSEWIDPPEGGGGGGSFDWTGARRASAFSSDIGMTVHGMSLSKRGNEALKIPTNAAYTYNLLDGASGVYLEYTSPSTYQMVGTSHQGMYYSRRRGFKIFEVFGLENTGNNTKLTAFIGTSSNNWGTSNDWKTDLPDMGYTLGVGFREGQANWQFITSSAGRNGTYTDLGVAKPTGTKILFSFEMSCDPGSNLVKIVLRDLTNNVTICDRFVEIYSDQEAGASLIGTTGDHGKIGGDSDYSARYFYSFFSTGSQEATVISYVHSRTHVETPF